MSRDEHCSHGVPYRNAECIECELVWQREALASAERRAHEAKRAIQRLLVKQKKDAA